MSLERTSVYINHSKLAEIISDKNIKMTWLAHTTQVDRKTISRWLNGKVKRIHKENFDRLVAALECEPLDIMSKESAFATEQDQLQAAISILDSNLLDNLMNMGIEPILEKLLKGLLSPRLPPRILSSLYEALSKICQIQDRQSEAKLYLQYSRESELHPPNPRLTHS